MFDTHCHLNLNPIAEHLDSSIREANKNGVDFLLVPGIDIPSSQTAVITAQNYIQVYAAVGIHPESIKPDNIIENQLMDIKKILSDKKVVAIGEIGLDIKSSAALYGIGGQLELFTAQLRLAISENKSVIIHNRGYADTIIQELTKHWTDSLTLKSVFHCCEPSDKLLSFAQTQGMYIGVDGDVTYSIQKQEFIKKVPLDSLVLETDSPFLTPEPVRNIQKFPNHPKNLIYIAKKVAELNNLPVEKVIHITAKNSKKLFNIK